MSWRLRSAVLISSILNLALVLVGSYRRSYDAYIHMFFADHYRVGWWQAWEPRWYGGFTVESYPPLVHQLIALLSVPLGIDAAFAIILLAALAALPLGIFAFARIFTGRMAAEYAALGAAVLPAAYISAHTFGQLPTLFSLLFALLTLAALAAFLRTGALHDGLLAIVLIAVVAASHHATLIFMPPAIAAVALHLWLNRRVALRILILRLLAYSLAAGCAVLLVVWPFWQWSTGQTLQTAIDHPTRHNYLRDPIAFTGFFLAMYGPLIIVIPWVFWRAAGRRMIALGLLFTLLFVLGLGGTTPLPRLLFGAAWTWLTYDRFALWAAAVLLIFLGQLMVFARRRVSRSPWLRSAAQHGLVAAALVLILGSVAVLDGLVPVLMPVQPPRLDMGPIQRFLAANNGDGWYYYLTFGFGDQLALLSRLTPSRTLDGSYHTARPIPELRSSGLAQLDTALWFPGGMAALDGILDPIAARGARWAFVDRHDYVQLLRAHGWRYLVTLSNGVQVWDNPAAPLPTAAPPDQASPLAEFSWGSLPLASLIIAAALAFARWQPLAALKSFRLAYLVSLGFLPLGLSFWYFRTLAVGDDPRPYLTYGDTLFFVSDLLVLLCVVAWGLQMLVGSARGAGTYVPRRPLIWLRRALLAAVVWCSLSILWSIEPLLSLGFAVQAWLLFALFVSLKGNHRAWDFLAWGCAIALTVQLFVGLVETATRSTAILLPLRMVWPGNLTASTGGASVVQLAGGERWLRLYGTLAHPNLLAGLLLLLLAGTVYLALRPGWQRWPATILFGGGVALLILTFSRAAWLGFATASGLIIVRRASFGGRRLLPLAAAAGAAAATAAIPLAQLIASRLVPLARAGTFDPELVSGAMRGYLSMEALRLIQLYPILGSGAGTFVVALSRLLPPYFAVEPVHNVFLLGWEELGPVAAILVLAIAAVVIWCALQARSSQAVLAAALVLGLMVIGLLDHYLWTLAPMRALAWLAMGVMAASIGIQPEITLDEHRR